MTDTQRISRNLLSWFLMIFGGFCLVALLVLAVIVGYRIGPGNRDRIDSASRQEVVHVLNWCGLGAGRFEQVLHSHISARSVSGDHLDAFAIRISEVEISELLAKTNHTTGQWYRGDQLPPLLQETVSFVAGWQTRLPWFPPEAELRSAGIYAFPWSIYCRGLRPSAAEVIFVRPADKTVFFLGAKL